MSSEPLVLPPAPPPRRRGSLPLVAAVVPVIGGVVMWLVTGSLLALCFAALGPLMAVASLVDGVRMARRDRRDAARQLDEAHARVGRELEVRHGAERARLVARHPDVATFVGDPGAVWRVEGERIAIGRGEVESRERVSGAHDDPASVVLARRAGVLVDAPVTVPIAAGVCVAGHTVVAAAALRALVLQLCLALPPDQLAIVQVPPGEEEWARMLPHRASRAPGALRLAVAGEDEVALPSADVVLAHTRATPPSRCAALIEIETPDAAQLTFDGHTVDLAVECASRAQAAAFAEQLAKRWDAARPVIDSRPVAFAGLAQPAPRAGGLVAAIGREGAETCVIDLVADGPHAIVTGVTGSGKSELLITWVTALCATYTTAEVAFLLADFKGGSAFDPLEALPHVTGVITDLDGSGARRAVESLRAELRRREAELARAGARDIDAPGVDLPRLMIVVDEFAALLADHPDLGAVFTDVAARGRALGMHLVLGTQRLGGTVRDGLLANCPLRLSLRVTDPADSRAVIGTDEAAHLPGGTEGRGAAFVRGAADGAPRAVRVALTAADDIARVAGERQAEQRPRRPWLPTLPARIGLHELPAVPGIALGLADDPAAQRQEVAVLGTRGLVVIGGPASGKTALVSLVGHQCPDALVLPDDPEAAWDALSRLDPRRPLVIDDVDTLLARLPQEYAQAAGDLLEMHAREAPAAGGWMLITAQRLHGTLARVADLISARAVLALASRADHVAAGGDPERYVAWAPPGRGELRGQAVQFALAPGDVGEQPAAFGRSEGSRGWSIGAWGDAAGSADATADETAAAPADADVAPLWQPTAPLTAAVLRGGERALRTRVGAARVIRLADVPPGASLADLAQGTPVVVAGDLDGWQAQWNLLQAIRAEHPVLVDAALPAALRTLLGERDLPPYARAGADRAWLCHDGRPPRRVRLGPQTDPFERPWR